MGQAARLLSMPDKEFRVQLKNLVRRVATIATKLGDEAAAANLDGFMTRGTGGRLPGYEVTVFFDVVHFVRGGLPVAEAKNARFWAMA